MIHSEYRQHIDSALFENVPNQSDVEESTNRLLDIFNNNRRAPLISLSQNQLTQIGTQILQECIVLEAYFLSALQEGADDRYHLGLSSITEIVRLSLRIESLGRRELLEFLLLKFPNLTSDINSSLTA